MSAENKRTIFLVDDEPIQNEMLKDYLSERFGYDIRTYANGEDALKNMQLNPEVVVLDYHLSANNTGAKDGVEILKEIKEKYPEVRVIMLSGQDKIEVAIDSMKYGAYDYVVKGETAFSRTENILNNITELSATKALNSVYKRTIVLLAVVVILFILIALYLGFFTNAYVHS